MLRLKTKFYDRDGIPYLNDVDKNYVTILCFCYPILILYLHAEPPERVKNYIETRQDVNNLSRKVCVLKILQEWASIVLNFSKCEVKDSKIRND